MDYNDQRKYAKLANVSDINSENDVKGILDAYNAEHTSQAELEAFGESLKPDEEESSTATDAPVELSPEMQQARERVQNFEGKFMHQQKQQTGTNNANQASNDAIDNAAAKLADTNLDGAAVKTDDSNVSGQAAAEDLKHKYVLNIGRNKNPR